MSRVSLGNQRILLTLGVLIVACSPEAPVVPALRLLDFRPRQRAGVYLNEPLVLHFSGELSRESITSQSVRILNRDGSPALGARFVAGRELTFLPDPVRAPNLQDGGYTPNTAYQLELAGFPRADAIRSKDGACLASTLHIAFQTVKIENPRTGDVFLDDSPDYGLPLLIHSKKSSNSQPVRAPMTSQSGLDLEGEEPIDPSTISDDVFALIRDEEPSKGSKYPLRAFLIDNHNKHAYFAQGTTLLRLLPDTLVPPGIYRLQVESANLHIRDFGRHLVPVIGKEGLQKLHVIVHAPSDGIESEYVEEFLDAGMRSSALVPGADGTALWSNTGAVEIRFPAAAGDGSDDAVVLEAHASSAHVQATRLSLPEGVSCELDVGEGTCRLCSQGALEIGGKLHRTGSAQPGALPEIRPDDTLSGWLERQGNANLPLTVLVAGGDLRISGELDLPGPLLLVAGGRVRVSGRIRVAGCEPIDASFFTHHDPTVPSHVAALGEGGAIAVWATVKGKGAPRAELADAWLVLDPPKINPLKRDLIYAVRSNPIPEKGRAKNWLTAEGPKGRSGAGSLRVRYAGERRSAGASGEIEVQVDDPALLVDCPTMRLVLELHMPATPGKRWDPPMLDSVRVRWEFDR